MVAVCEVACGNWFGPLTRNVGRRDRWECCETIAASVEQFTGGRTARDGLLLESAGADDRQATRGVTEAVKGVRL